MEFPEEAVILHWGRDTCGSERVSNASAAARGRVGSLIAGKYRLDRVIGTGATGAVYAAVHQFTRKPVALKVIDASIAEYEGYGVRFLREARAAAEIDHPVICDVSDAGREPDGSLYIALELLEGSTLDAAIEANDLRLDEIVQVGVQVLDGMAAAHDRGIVHRDIKPENIFLTRDERGNLRVKIIDFGVAKHSKSGPEVFSTQQGAVLGTPWYMAPEQAAGDPVDNRADVWSVGAVLFHALTGRPPYDEDSYNRLIAKLMNTDPPRLKSLRPGLPDWIATAVDGALQRNPTERWQSARTMAETLRLKGEAPIGLDWEVHEDATVRTESAYQGEEESRPATLQLLNGQSQAPSIELDISLEEEISAYASADFPAFDASGGRTIKSSVPPALMPPPAAKLPPRAALPARTEQPLSVPPPPRPTKKGRGGLWLGVALGMLVGVLMALGAAWVVWAHVLSP